jgi:VWFA-related protein
MKSAPAGFAWFTAGFLAAVHVSAQQSPSLTEVLDVRVTNVDVVVTDGRGNPVPGLTAADFEILENGRPQPITNFYEVSGGAASIPGGDSPSQPAAPQQSEAASPDPRTARKFIFYFDNSSLSVKNRNAIFPAARDFLKKNMRPGDQAMVVSWNRQLKVRQPWTSDVAAIDAVMKTMAGEQGGAAEIDGYKRRIELLLREMSIDATYSDKTGLQWQELEASARSYAESVKHDVTASVNATAKLLSTLSGVDGRKVMVMATESLPTTAGSDVFDQLDHIQRQIRVQPAQKNLFVPGSGSKVGDLSRFSTVAAIETLAKAANATGVTIYALNPKPYSGDESGKVELQRASDVLGAGTTQFASAVEGMDGVNMLARETGGVAMVGAAAPVMLAEVERDLGSYYSLGYRTAPGDDPARAIEVNVKRAGLRVRSRRSIYHRSMETEMADRVIANHLQDQFANELGVQLQAEPASVNGRTKSVPLRIIIPVDNLTLLPDGENVSGGFTVFVCTGDGEGNTSGVNMQSHKIKWPAAQLLQMKGKAFGFAVEVPIEGTRDQISVGVVDNVSRVSGFSKLKVEG